MKAIVKQRAVDALLLAIVSAILFIFLVDTYGSIRFLTSAEFINGSAKVVLWATHLTALMITVALLFKGVIAAYRISRRDGHDKLLLAPTICVLLWWMLYVFCAGAVPLVSTYFNGSLRQEVLVVKDTASGSRHCRRSVTFEDLSVWSNKICGLPQKQFDRLDPGERVKVEGIGNGLGLRSVRIVAHGVLNDG